MALTRKVKTGSDLGYGLDGAGGAVTAVATGQATAGSTTGDTTAPMATVTGVELGGELTVNASAKDSQGATVAHLIGAQKNTLKIDGYASAFAVPKVGDVVGHGGASGLVISSNISASNEDFVKASLSAEGGAGIDYGTITAS
jgi:hypothetical protein